MKRLKPTFLFIVFALLLGAVVGCDATHEFGGATYSEPIEIADFTLTGVDGPVNLSDFAGKYVMVYFGYTYCPDVCPATLSELRRVGEQLESDMDDVQVIMITVDPERDTPEKTHEYASYFDPSFIGLSGSKLEIDTAAAPFGIYYEKHDGSAESGYLVDHTARTYLIDPEGRALVAYPFETRAESMVDDLRYLFKQDG
jgi:protein SCO1/2